jgi:hypothetical protein
MLVSASLIFGSGMPTGFANEQHVPPYAQLDAAIVRELAWRRGKPLAIRLDVVNVLDASGLLRSGNGIGELAPQYGPRRGVFVGLTPQL